MKILRSLLVQPLVFPLISPLLQQWFPFPPVR